MSDIKHFKIKRELSTGEHLSVYQVENDRNGKTAILRIVNHVAQGESWRALYKQYKKIKHKNLPALSTIDSWNDRPFAVLHEGNGDWLEKGKILTGKQIGQLFEAVSVLHENNFLFGKISRFNIWIRDNGDLSLHGAGERSVFFPESTFTIQDDVGQVLTILKKHSSIPESFYKERSFDNLEQLQDEVLRKLLIPRRGLLDSASNVFTSPDRELGKNMKSPEPEKTISMTAPVPLAENRKRPSVFIWLTGIALVLSIIFSIGWLQHGKTEKASIIGDSSKKPTSLTRNQPNKAVKRENLADKDDETDLSQFSKLFTGWDLKKSASIMLGSSEYIIIAAAQKRDDSSGVVKLSVLSKGKNGEWNKVSDSKEYKFSFLASENYINSLLTVSEKGQNMALVALAIQDSGFPDLVNITALTIGQEGKLEQVWDGIGSKFTREGNKIIVFDVGMKRLSLVNGKFIVEEFSRSESAPSEAKILPFDLSGSGEIITLKQREITLRVGEKLAIVPSPKAKDKFDKGEILIYTDVFTKGEMTLLEQGNYVEFTSPGEYHFVLNVWGSGLDHEKQNPTFTAFVKK